MPASVKIELLMRPTRGCEYRILSFLLQSWSKYDKRGHRRIPLFIIGERRTGRLTKYCTNGSCMYPSCTADLLWRQLTHRGRHLTGNYLQAADSGIVVGAADNFVLGGCLKHKSQLADCGTYRTEACPDGQRASTYSLSSDERSYRKLWIPNLYIKLVSFFLLLFLYLFGLWMTLLLRSYLPGAAKTLETLRTTTLRDVANWWII